MFYILTSTALVLFKLDGLFSDYIFMQMAQERDEGNNHHFLSCRDSTFSFSYEPNVMQMGIGFSYTVLSLPVFIAILQKFEGRSVSRML